MKFIHCADLHLDSPLTGLTRRENLPVEKIRQASRSAFTRMIDVALDEQVDFLVMAGDLFDGDWPDYGTGLFFIEQMGRLKRAEIPVYLLHGNHDAANKMHKRLTLPDNVHVFGHHKAESFILDAVGVALHGQSYAHAEQKANMLPAYPSPRPDLFNIGVLHTALDGRTGHAPYAPCTLADLKAKGYDYWALGHVHTRATPHESHPVVHFPGNLQGRHPRETGPKGFTLVRVSDGRVTLEMIPADVVRWESLEVTHPRPLPWSTLAAQLNERFRTLMDASEDRPLLVRVRLRVPPMPGEPLFTDPVALFNDCQGIALALSDALWIESCRWDSPPFIPEDRIGEAQRDLLAALSEARADPGVLAALARELETLVGKMPSGSSPHGADWPPAKDAWPACLDGLLEEAHALLRFHLAGSDGTSP